MDLYHALNRGVDKRTIFLDTQDYARFVHDLYIFNSNLPANNTNRYSMVDLRSRPLNETTERIVDVHGWCLMPNHYHLLLSERVEGGLVQFLRKLNVGYAKYFNERYDRSGTLFQGRTKKIRIDKDAYLMHILNYIHSNPLDMLSGARDWRVKAVNSDSTTLEYLSNYKWSSYRDYTGIKNFPSILTTKFFLDVFNNDYTGQLRRYLHNTDTDSIRDIVLE